MAKYKIAIRADADNKIGGGHIYRCLTLANYLSEIDIEIVFVTNPKAIEIAPFLANHHIEMVQSGSGFSEFPDDLDCDALIVDHYGWAERDYIEARRKYQHLIALSDTPNKFLDVSIIIDQNIGYLNQSYSDYCENNTLVLGGPDYALLRPEFSVNRQQSLTKQQKPKRLDHIIINLGLSDQTDKLAEITKNLDGSLLGAKIDVIIGNLNLDQKFQNGLSAKNSWNFISHIDDIAQTMLEIDLCIGAAGVSNLERCCLGIPSIQLILADNQFHSAQIAQQHGACIAIDARDGFEGNDLNAALDNLKDPKARINMSREAAKLCDGMGTARVGQQILKLLQ